MKKISLTLALAAALTLGAAGLASAETSASRTYMDSLIRAEHQDQDFRRPPARRDGPGPVIQQPTPEAKPGAQPPQDFKNAPQPPQDFKAPGQPPENCPPDFRGNPPRPKCAENAPAPGMRPPENCPPPDFRGRPCDDFRHPDPRQCPPPECRDGQRKEYRHHDGEKRDKEFRHHKERRDGHHGRRDGRPPREARANG